MRVSAFICVCAADDAGAFLRAYESVRCQTVPADEIVICADGVLSEELERALDGIKHEVKTVRCFSGGSHALSRQTALDACDGEVVAVMDSDDICLPTRFETLLPLIYGGADAAGGAITEFDGKDGRITGRRVPPQTDDELKKYMKKRCPFNHMTVMYKKSSVQASGGYLDMLCNEDYYLWIRMARRGCTFANTEKTLCLVRTDGATYARRGGKEYYKSEKTLQRYMLDGGMISPLEYARNLALRFVAQRLMSARMRRAAYSALLRKK